MKQAERHSRLGPRKRVVFWMSAAEHEAMQKEAARLGIPVSEFIRRCVAGQSVK